MFCPRCGAPANPGVPVCPSCGQGMAVPAKKGMSTVLIVVLVVAALGLIAVVAIGIIAAIAIPSLLRARIAANEAMAIGNLRTVISAEAAYQSANGLMNLFIPTSAVVMGGLAIARVPYGRYLKWVWPLLAMLGVLAVIVLAGGAALT